MTIEIQSAQPADTAEIAALFAGGFRPEVTQLLVHGCHGAAERIRMQLASASACAESAYFVARSFRGIAGAAEMRKRPDGLFLNYIGVRLDCRGHGVGTALLSGAVTLAAVLPVNLPSMSFTRTQPRSAGTAALD